VTKKSWMFENSHNETQHKSGLNENNLESGLEALVAPKDRPWTAASIPSYYRMERTSSNDTFVRSTRITRDTDSPIYGLNGVMARTGKQEAKHERPGSSASFNELLRQQSELDKSITALRLFHNKELEQNSSDPGVQPIPSLVPEPVENETGRVTSGSSKSFIARKQEYTSNQSDFSLSIFPEPPGVTMSDLPASIKLEKLAGRAKVLGQQPLGTAGSDEIVAVESSLPVSPNGYEGSRMGSAGTQYDVTSFIGGLTQPGPRGSSLAAGPVIVSSNSRLSVVESENERSPTTPMRAMSPPRPLPMITRPRRLPRIPDGQKISDPYNMEDGRDGRTPEAFERPRPPPLILPK